MESVHGTHGHAGHKSLFTRMREAMGTVYGDIGTSVLYTVNEIIKEIILIAAGASSLAALQTGRYEVDPMAVMGGVSLIFWAIVFLTIKYDLLIMRADNKGEGGTFALWALIKGATGKVAGIGFLGLLVVKATGLLAADGVITPVISILGAYEPLGESWAIVATIATLTALFKVQWRGTSKVGGAFGWFMLAVWFPWVALKGLPWVLKRPDVLYAVDPSYAYHFLVHHTLHGALVILGVVVLSVTGGEAKYADMGHCGRKPIVLSWACIAPCLLLNYFGQAAYVLERGVTVSADAEGVKTITNVYYALLSWYTETAWLGGLAHGLRTADMVISACAAIIASQALISGMFSVVKQAITLGFSPRSEVRYTDREMEGQVYLPAVNWSLYVLCVITTLYFRNASNLAAAYGIAVTGTMAITTYAFGYVAYYRRGWWLAAVVAVCTPLIAVDLVFFVANTLKFTDGGWFPIVIAAVLIACMLTWQWGRRQLAKAYAGFNGKTMEWVVGLRLKLDEVNASLEGNLRGAAALIQGKRKLVELDRAVVFLTSRPVRSTEDGVPHVLRVFLKKYGGMPKHLVLLHVNITSAPDVPAAERYEVIELGPRVVSIVVSYGYMEKPDIRKALHELRSKEEIHLPSDRWIIETGKEKLIVEHDTPLPDRLRATLFSWMLNGSAPAHEFFGLGHDAGVSQEVVPVVMDRTGVRCHIPELEASVHVDAGTNGFIGTDVPLHTAL